MDYRDWVKDFEAVQSQYFMADADRAETGRQLDRLRALLSITEPVDRREWGEAELASLENAMSPEAETRRTRAERAYRKGINAQGSDAEIRTALVTAIADIEAIASETDDWDEQRQLTGPTEALATEIAFIDSRAG